MVRDLGLVRNNIGGREEIAVAAIDLAHDPLYAVASHRVTDLLGNGDAETPGRTHDGNGLSCRTVERPP